MEELRYKKNVYSDFFFIYKMHFFSLFLFLVLRNRNKIKIIKGIYSL